MYLTRLIAALGLGLVAAAAHADPDLWRGEWPETDFSRTTLESWSEVISGGPPKDGIPALTDPDFIPVGEASGIGDREPVMAVEIDGARPRAYPIRYLTWHEIANDRVGGVPIAVTFCPLCNSGITFDRRLEGEVLEFGVSGKLRNSDMIMFDRQTQSWWQQAVGRGIVGEHAGDALKKLPSWMESWAKFRTRNPDGLVMAEPDYPRAYGRNPYAGYDTGQPFLYSGEKPPHGIAPMARVIAVGDRAWPMERLREAGTINEAGLTLTWEEGQASALDTARIGKGREIGNIRVRNAQGEDVAHDIPFAFAFHAFHPDGEWMLGG